MPLLVLRSLRVMRPLQADLVIRVVRKHAQEVADDLSFRFHVVRATVGCVA